MRLAELKIEPNDCHVEMSGGRHELCRGYRIETLDGTDYDCAYENAPECEDCLYGPMPVVYAGTRIDPETGGRVKVNFR